MTIKYVPGTKRGETRAIVTGHGQYDFMVEPTLSKSHMVRVSIGHGFMNITEAELDEITRVLQQARNFKLHNDSLLTPPPEPKKVVKTFYFAQSANASALRGGIWPTWQEAFDEGEDRLRTGQWSAFEVGREIRLVDRPF